MALLHHSFGLYLCLAMIRNKVYMSVCTSSGRCLMSSFVIASGPSALSVGARVITVS